MGEVRQLPRCATVVVKQGAFHINLHMNSASVDSEACSLPALKYGNFSDCAGRTDGTSWQELRVAGNLLMDLVYSESESFQEPLAQERASNLLRIFRHSGKNAPDIWTTLFAGHLCTPANMVIGRKKEQVPWQVSHRCDTNLTDFSQHDIAIFEMVASGDLRSRLLRDYEGARIDLALVFMKEKQSTAFMAVLFFAFSILMCMRVLIRDALNKKPVYHVIERKNELDEYF